MQLILYITIIVGALKIITELPIEISPIWDALGWDDIDTQGA